MKRKIVKNMMLCTLSSMFLVTGCGNTEIKNSTNQGEKTQQVSETAVTFTDDLGREVTVESLF